jgi:hypothetical protein
VTRRSIMEYAEAVKGRYLGASKKEKAKILDEFVAVTQLHRKAAIRLLSRLNGSSRGAAASTGRKRRGRPPEYDLAVVAALKIAWEAGFPRFCRSWCAF